MAQDQEQIAERKAILEFLEQQALVYDRGEMMSLNEMVHGAATYREAYAYIIGMRGCPYCTEKCDKCRRVHKDPHYNVWFFRR